MRRHSPVLLLALVAIAALPACTTTQSTRAKALKPAAAATAQTVRDCRTLTVLPFAVPAGKRVDASAGQALGRDVARRLGSDFGTLFEVVDYADAAKGGTGECVLRGEITKYKKGSKVARFILIGLAPASLEGHIAVVDAGGATLLDAPFDKLWAWGGIAGASKGIEDMQVEVGASIANTVARAKGWTPPAK
jgi:hypothetical protein